LRRLPAVGDNAAMQTEPPKADPPRRKRRWFQFSLRSLLIGVPYLGVYAGVMLRIAAIPKSLPPVPTGWAIIDAFAWASITGWTMTFGTA